MKTRKNQKTMTITGNISRDVATLMEIYADRGYGYRQHIAGTLQRAADSWNASADWLATESDGGSNYPASVGEFRKNPVTGFVDFYRKIKE